MSPTDKKSLTLVTQTTRPRLRRTVNTHHYALPKPYRRKRLLEERPRWKRKLGFYVVSGLVIGTLIGQVAEVAEQARREREMPIIAAVPDDTGQGAAAAPPASALGPLEPPAAPPADALTAQQLPPAPPAPAQGDGSEAPGMAAPVGEPSPAPTVAISSTIPRPAARRHKPAPSAPQRSTPPDPDVVLISAILMLGPTLFGEAAPAAADCPADAPQDAACADLHGVPP